MPSPLLVVFLLQLIIHLINTVGASTISELLWTLYNKLPTPTSNAAQQSTRLKGEVLRLKKDMNGVSAQDDFTKWAKLRRQHDKVVADYEKNSMLEVSHHRSKAVMLTTGACAAASLSTSKTQFTAAVTGLRWVGLNGVRTLLQFWFAKTPIFWIPRGWVPGYVEWIVSFPRAPVGSVGVQVWGIACASVILMVSDALVAGYALGMGQKVAGKEEARGFGMGGLGGSGVTSPKRKKEL